MDILDPTNLSTLEDDDLSSAIELMLDGSMPSVPVIRNGNKLTGM